MKRIFIWLPLLALVLTACEVRVHLSEADFEEQNDSIYCYVNGQRYSGFLWSRNEQMRVNVKNGVVGTITIYHSNGQKAALVNPDSEPQFWDEQGNSMSIEDFEEQYGDFYQQLAVEMYDALP